MTTLGNSTEVERMVSEKKKRHLMELLMWANNISLSEQEGTENQISNT
jgi:hypothetical protein